MQSIRKRFSNICIFLKKNVIKVIEILPRIDGSGDVLNEQNLISSLHNACILI